VTTEEAYTLAQAHEPLAKATNREVWDLLGKADRSGPEDEAMVLAAYASLYHWTHTGTVVHRQRGEWLIAHVHSVLGHAEGARRHAARCLQLTEDHRDQMEDFDMAYAYEGMARALAVAGELDAARRHLLLAQAAGEAITDEESKAIFQGDLASGNWHGAA
jgi:hypothetical protein